VLGQMNITRQSRAAESKKASQDEGNNRFPHGNLPQCVSPPIR